MLLYRLKHTFEAIDKLLIGVHTKVIPSVALHGDVCRNAAQREQLLAAVFLQLRLLLVEVAKAAAKGVMVFVGKSVENLVKLVEGKAVDETLGAGDMLLEQFENNLRVFGAHHELEDVVLLLLARLLVVGNLATHEQCNGKSHEEEHDHEASEIHCHADNGAGGESHTSSDEPTTDDGEHSSDTEHGTLAAPCAVGKRCTHCHHECNVGG